jgi:hypothetical protein
MILDDVGGACGATAQFILWCPPSPPRQGYFFSFKIQISLELPFFRGYRSFRTYFSAYLCCPVIHSTLLSGVWSPVLSGPDLGPANDQDRIQELSLLRCLSPSCRRCIISACRNLRPIGPWGLLIYRFHFAGERKRGVTAEVTRGNEYEC